MLHCMAIFVTGDLDAAALAVWQQALAAALPEEAVHADAVQARSAGADVAVVANPPPGSLAGWPGLRLIHSVWAGVDRLLADGSLPQGVPVARMVDPLMTAAMTETGVWAVLSLQRHFFDYAQQQARGQWQVLPQRRAEDCRVLVLGLGEMGRSLAAALLALGFPVSGWRAGDVQRPPLPGLVAWSGAAALPEALAGADVLVNLLPLTPATRGLLNRDLLALLPAGAALVNLGRGAHLVEADLLAALDQGRLSRALLDVFAVEPLPADHPFWRHPRVSLLPHAAAQTDVASAAQQVALNVRALRSGQPLRHLVQRERGY